MPRTHAYNQPRGPDGAARRYLAYGADYNPEQWSREVWAEDVRLMREMAQLFLDTAPTLLDGLRKALRAGNAPEVRRLAHSIKGAVGNFGAHATEQAAHTLEQLGREAKLAEAPAALAALEEALRQLEPALLELLNEKGE